MENKLEMPLEQFAEAVAKENERLNEKEWCHGCHQRLTDETMCGSQRCPDPVSAFDYAPIALKRIVELENEIIRLKQKCDKQAMILRRLTPDKHPDTLFISGVLGKRDENNMPERLTVVPAYGVDFAYVYEYTGFTMGQEW